ncbi:MAG: HAMP domain-containing sensor histidine kinase [Syntrophomonadaceae bacterium]|nr:HAMP domain-containing sensor histidine kinase [Syntrophomonadaceae bacterium]
MRFSITFKTTITYTLIFSIILFLLGAAVISASGFILLHESNQAIEKNAKVINNLIQESPELPQEKIKKYAAIEGISVIVFDKDDELLYDSGEIEQKTGPKIDFNYPLIRITPSTSLDEYLHYETTVKLADGFGQIKIAKDLTEERYYLVVLIIAAVCFIILSIIIMVIIGSKTTRRMLRPIDHMTRTARSISFGDLNTRLDVVDSHDELKEMAETFNGMLERIQRSVEQQNVFVSDASHELRTPIAVIQGYANLLQRWGKEDRAVLDESVAAIKNESDYMKELVEKLLFLASADKQAQKLEMKPFSLSELLDEALKEARLIDSEHTISGDISENMMVNGDRGLIKQALRIFIDNSLKYTPAGGIIKLNGYTGSQQTMITIEDNGVGISTEDLPYIFNRFYKADKSRSREAGGAGLGLSIAKWIIEQHKGSIKVESDTNQGTKIIIVLPAWLQAGDGSR